MENDKKNTSKQVFLGLLNPILFLLLILSLDIRLYSEYQAFWLFISVAAFLFDYATKSLYFNFYYSQNEKQ